MRRTSTTLTDGPSGRGNGPKILALLATICSLATVWILALALLGEDTHDAAAPGKASTPTKEETTPSTAPAPVTSVEPPRAEEVDREPVAASSHDRSGANEATTQGAPHEPGNYDPLGTGASSSDLSETEKGRVELAAGQFVIHAYGFTGRGAKARKQYEAGISRNVLVPDFYGSEGAAVLADLARRVEADGTRSTAHLVSFEFDASTLTEARGAATFIVRSGGGERRYIQDLRIGRRGDVWRVAGAGPIRDTA